MCMRVVTAQNKEQMFNRIVESVRIVSKFFQHWLYSLSFFPTICVNLTISRLSIEISSFTEQQTSNHGKISFVHTNTYRIISTTCYCPNDWIKRNVVAVWRVWRYCARSRQMSNPLRRFLRFTHSIAVCSIRSHCFACVWPRSVSSVYIVYVYNNIVLYKNNIYVIARTLRMNGKKKQMKCTRKTHGFEMVCMRAIECIWQSYSSI